MNRCGRQQPDYSGPAEIYDEMAALVPRFAGISHQRVDREGGLQWPVPTANAPSTEFLHAGGVLRGKGLFQPVEYKGPHENPDDDYPLVLSTGRTLYHYNAATQTRRSEGLTDKQPEAYVEVHPEDGEELGLIDGQYVHIVSRRGRVKARALWSGQVRRGSVWMPFHFPTALANHLTVDAGDAVTGTGEYKVCAVRLESVSEPNARKRFRGSAAAVLRRR